jgi:hypothetical protein
LLPCLVGLHTIALMIWMISSTCSVSSIWFCNLFFLFSKQVINCLVSLLDIEVLFYFLG